MVCRWDVVEVYSVATARTASHFLAALKERSPFPIRAVQVDGGSEFMGEFEIACRGSDLQLFVLPPRSPKLNGHASGLRGPTRRSPACRRAGLGTL